MSTNAAIDRLLGAAIIQAQKMVGLMSQSCEGGDNGQNPHHFDEFRNFSDQVGRTLVEIRLALAAGQAPNAGQQIDAVEQTLNQMVGMMHDQCPGGAHGRDPYHYGDLINIKQRVLGSLDAVKEILTDN